MQREFSMFSGKFEYFFRTGGKIGIFAEKTGENLMRIWGYFEVV